jgi:opacity protein-like surface antigen
MPRRLLHLLPLSAVLALVGPAPTAAQSLELAPFIAYRAGGEFRDASVKDNEAFGGTLTFIKPGGFGGEFVYSHQSSEVDIPGAATVDLDVDQWGLMGIREISRPDSRARPYAGVGIGLTHFDAGAAGGSSTRFSTLFDLGVKVFPTKSIGLRFGGRGYLAFVNSSSGFYCGTGGGCSVGFSGSVFFQADLAAAVVIAFGPRRQEESLP